MWTNSLTAIGTLSAVLVALWVAIFGPRRVTRPKLSVTLSMESPDCIASFNRNQRMKAHPSGPDYYTIRPQVENHGNEDARDVEVKMLRLWIVNDNGETATDALFLPLVLPWSWWPSPSLPMVYMPKLIPGMPKHFDLIVVAPKQHSRRGGRRWHHRETFSEPWIIFQHAYIFPDGVSEKDLMRKPPGQYQLDFIVSASNAKTIYRTAYINFKGWRNSATEMFSKGGGLNIEIAETPRGR